MKKFKDFLFKARFFILGDVCPCCRKKMDILILGDRKCHECEVYCAHCSCLQCDVKGKDWSFGGFDWMTKKEMWRQSKLRAFQ